MKNYTFHWELETLLKQFMAAFNDVVIYNYDNNRNKKAPTAGIKVNYYFAPKTRVYSYLKQNGVVAAFKAPAIAVYPISIQRDPNRIVSKNSTHFLNNGPGYINGQKVTKVASPVPINLTVGMTIVTQFQSDMDQILSNFIPYTDPYVIISWLMPQPDQEEQYEIRTEVLWSGNVDIKYPLELEGNQSYRIVAETSFIIKGYLFKKYDEPINKIYVINSDYTPIEDVDFEFQTLEDTTEFFTISARPIIKSVDTDTIWINSFSDYPVVNVYGDNFLYTNNIYLSASGPNIIGPMSFFNPFSAVQNLSATYPGFHGIQVPDFTISTDNHLGFEFPIIPFGDGKVDLIIENEAGYGKLTSDTLKPYINPYPADNPLHNTYVQPQPPYSSGIEIKVI